MASVTYKTKDGKFTYYIHPALDIFLRGFGQDIMYKVQKLPEGLSFVGHSQLRPCHCSIYGRVGKELYLSFTPDNGKTHEYYRLFT